MRDRLQLGTGTVCMSSHHMESIPRLISTFRKKNTSFEIRQFSQSRNATFVIQVNLIETSQSRKYGKQRE
jgi:hypothetical protein